MRVDLEVPVSAKPSEALARVIRDVATTDAKRPKAVPIRCRCIFIVLPSRAVSIIYVRTNFPQATEPGRPTQAVLLRDARTARIAAMTSRIALAPKVA